MKFWAIIPSSITFHCNSWTPSILSVTIATVRSPLVSAPIYNLQYFYIYFYILLYILLYIFLYIPFNTFNWQQLPWYADQFAKKPTILCDKQPRLVQIATIPLSSNAFKYYLHNKCVLLSRQFIIFNNKCLIFKKNIELAIYNFFIQRRVFWWAAWRNKNLHRALQSRMSHH